MTKIYNSFAGAERYADTYLEEGVRASRRAAVPDPGRPHRAWNSGLRRRRQESDGSVDDELETRKRRIRGAVGIHSRHVADVRKRLAVQ